VVVDYLDASALVEVSLVEVSLVDGRRTVLSRFPSDSACEFGTQPCASSRIQLATDLLGAATMRAPDADRGPWVTLVHTGLIVLGLGVVGLVALATAVAHAGGAGHPL
jgi:hypothetical protein